jgi:hypothetical protein
MIVFARKCSAGVATNPGRADILVRHLLLFSLLLAGCARRAAERVPDGALLIAEQTGRLAFAANDDGTVFIYDATIGQMAFTTPVRMSEKLLFFPERNQIYLNGQVVKEMTLNPKHIYHLYFSKG